MANIEASRLKQLLYQTCLILEQHPGGLPSREVFRILDEKVDLTEFELSPYRGNLRVFEFDLSYATSMLVKTNWVEKIDGLWQLTQEGAAAIDSHPDPVEFYRHARKLYNLWRKEDSLVRKTSDLIAEEQKAIHAEAVKNALNGHEEISQKEEEHRAVGILFDAAQEDADETIAQYISGIHPYQFQNMVGCLLESMGYFILWDASKPGPDGGVDIIAGKDPLCLSEPRIKVQVKRQQAAVGLPVLKSFIANIGPRDAGIFVCTGGFTDEAQRHARTLESKQLTIMNLPLFVKLWIEFYDRLSDNARQLLPLSPIYYLRLPE